MELKKLFQSTVANFERGTIYFSSEQEIKQYKKL